MGQIIQGGLLLVWVICYVIVVIKMFQNGKAGLGIVTLLSACVCVGWPIAFVYGWMKANEWNLRPVMLIWTGVMVVNVIAYIVVPVDVNQVRQQFGQ